MSAERAQRTEQARSVCYLDSSAIVKLVIREAESAALATHLAQRSRHISCALAKVEVIRAVRAHGADALGRARRALDGLGVIALDEPLLDSAAQLDPGVLRSLDSIHLAAAQALGDELSEVITYDKRMIDAARTLSLPVAAPGEPAPA